MQIQCISAVYHNDSCNDLSSRMRGITCVRTTHSIHAMKTMDPRVLVDIGLYTSRERLTGLCRDDRDVVRQAHSRRVTEVDMSLSIYGRLRRFDLGISSLAPRRASRWGNL
jgi:hypothetical protein